MTKEPTGIFTSHSQEPMPSSQEHADHSSFEDTKKKSLHTEHYRLYNNKGNWNMAFSSTKWPLYVAISLLLLLPSTHRGAEAHPLCLFWRGPFIPSAAPTVCTRYSNYTCCVPEEEVQIKANIELVLASLDPVEAERCRDRIQDVLCLKCSPFFAHTYDYEKYRKSAFPGLCREFCLQFHADCQNAIQGMTQDEKILNSAKVGEDFCQSLELSDEDYCYPAVKPLNAAALNPTFITATKQHADCICLETFAKELRNPLIFRPLPDDTGRVAVAEQRGVVYMYYLNGTREPEPFIDLQELVFVSTRRQDERGFLALAFHPEFSENQRVFLYITIQKNGTFFTVLLEYKISAKNINQIDHSSGMAIISIRQPYDNHNGGEVLFGPDGYLYLSTGDGGGAGDSGNYAQNKSTLLGKMLRLDVDNVPAGQTYGIPEDNPFRDEPGSREEIFAYGLRNPWRCDLDEGDPQTGDGHGRIFCGDVGQGKWEEVDIIEKGKNYGWSSREGFECYKQDLCDKIGPEVLPIHAYSHDIGKSITGGHVYRGCQSPKLNGKYIFGDFTHGGLFKLTEDEKSGNWTHERMHLCSPDKCGNGYVNRYEQHILSFGEDLNGEVYFLTSPNVLTNSPTGAIYKIVEPSEPGDLRKCKYDATGKRQTLHIPGGESSAISLRCSILLPLLVCLIFKVIMRFARH